MKKKLYIICGYININLFNAGLPLYLEFDILGKKNWNFQQKSLKSQEVLTIFMSLAEKFRFPTINLSCR